MSQSQRLWISLPVRDPDVLCTLEEAGESCFARAIASHYHTPAVSYRAHMQTHGKLSRGMVVLVATVQLIREGQESVQQGGNRRQSLPERRRAGIT